MVLLLDMIDPSGTTAGIAGRHAGAALGGGVRPGAAA